MSNFKAFTYHIIKDGYRELTDTNLVLKKGCKTMILDKKEIEQIEKAIGGKFEAGR